MPRWLRPNLYWLLVLVPVSVVADFKRPPRPPSLTNTASVTGQVEDPEPSNDSVSTTTRITRPRSGR